MAWYLINLNIEFFSFAEIDKVFELDFNYSFRR